MQRAGNKSALKLLSEVFEIGDRKWRGIGNIPQSGYRLTAAYAHYDARAAVGVTGMEVSESTLCMSGLILQGLMKPHECPQFGKGCTPEMPLGATMVSSEGACAAYYNYGHFREAQVA